jgi:hypothetical protein
MVGQASAIVDDAKQRYQEIRAVVDLVAQLAGGAKTHFEEARAAADANKDGETTLEEWLKWIAAIGGPSGLIAYFARNKLSNERKAALAARIETLEKAAG